MASDNKAFRQFDEDAKRWAVEQGWIEPPMTTARSAAEEAETKLKGLATRSTT